MDFTKVLSIFGFIISVTSAQDLQENERGERAPGPLRPVSTAYSPKNPYRDFEYAPANAYIERMKRGKSGTGAKDKSTTEKPTEAPPKTSKNGKSTTEKSTDAPSKKGKLGKSTTGKPTDAPKKTRRGKSTTERPARKYIKPGDSIKKAEKKPEKFSQEEDLGNYSLRVVS